MKGYLKKKEPACTYDGVTFVHGRLYDVPDVLSNKFKAPGKPKTNKPKPRKEKSGETSADLKVVENDG